jgi:hypothetical protein
MRSGHPGAGRGTATLALATIAGEPPLAVIVPPLDEMTLAAPAFANGRLLIRIAAYLYSIK